MVLKIFFIGLLAFTLVFAQDETDGTEAPPDVDTCRQAIDVVFVLDSSSSIGSDNFQLMKDYVADVIQGLEVNQRFIRVAASRYTIWTQEVFYLRQYNNREDAVEAVNDIMYFGKGTETARALVDTADRQLDAGQGWRGNNQAPTVVVVLTDGYTQDLVNLDQAARYLKRKVTRVVAIGLGTRILEEELNVIATEPAADNVILLRSFAELQDTDKVEMLIDKICDAAGDVNECLADNGGCQVFCINTYEGFYCDCPAGFSRVGTFNCEDIDECANATDTRCGQVCNNLPGSFECACNPGFLLAPNDRSCIADSCFENDACDQVCVNILEGTFECRCREGYNFDEETNACVDINECGDDGKGVCEFNCTNTPGSFICGCPPGRTLLADGLTCGLACYVCDKVASNEECDTLEVCQINERACQTTVRRENGVTLISKQCKQLEACVNNFVQNPRSAWMPFQCNNETASLSVCRCCCTESGCNQPADCSLANRIDIECPDPFDIFTPIPPLNLTCGGAPYLLGDTCSITCPTGFAPDNGITQLLCGQIPRTTDGQWIGTLGTCVDIDECAINNGGCSHTCINTNGSFVCSCPADNPCEEQTADIFFILDSSSSVGQANFDTMIGFVNNVSTQYNIGQDPDQTRIGVLTYNKTPRKRFALNAITDNEDFTTKLNAIVYEGRGTRTARAVDFTVRNCLTAREGRRPNKDLVVVLITDGRSQDHREIPAAAELLHATADQVFIIGVTNRVNENEIKTLADGDAANYRIVDGFRDLDDELGSLVGDRICNQPIQQQFLTSDERTCDFDECSVNDGGCSFNCTNTVGSFFCSCPAGSNLIEDRVTCLEDPCLIDNGNCQEGCTHLQRGRRCFCRNERVLIDETDCDDVDECLDENGGCDQECENLDPGYRCLCREGFVLAPDMETCEIDSCFDQPEDMRCAQECTNVFGGTYVCSCQDGYVLDEDNHNCTEIDECAVSNGGCQKTCVNTMGSFFCECDEGESLREDGRTCGILCFQCQNALSEDECQDSVACAPSQDSCFGTIRTRNNVTRITKGCQQREACINNMLQNNRPSGEGPLQCNNLGIHSKCECCCFSSLCNEGLCPYDFILPTCPVFITAREDISYYALTDDGSAVFAGGSAYVDCESGFELSQMGEAPHVVNCEYDFANNTASWDGDVEDLDVCVDIDECFNSTAGCVAPATCNNLPGSFECVCPDDFDDYILFDGIICERDECADPDMGGCSHNCTNTIGSYFCFCPSQFALIENTTICTLDQCRGHTCHQFCVNVMGGGIECRCEEGKVIGEDGYLCVDFNECDEANGGCADICNNLDPGFECACSPGFLLEEDGFSCAVDPCFDDNGGCEQICTPEEGLPVCSCQPGFILQEDGSCEDINECIDNAPGCENNCTNTEGSFFCECPLGTALRIDGRTCGRACYTCNGATTNAECNAQPVRVCPDDADACENEVRFHGTVKSIFKRCKQALACNNNFIQNPRTAWSPTQCNLEDQNNVCRCCCTGHLCNFNERPCATASPCTLDEADVIVVADSSSSVGFDNFQKMKSFIRALFSGFILGDDLVRAALIRYNRAVEEQFNLADINDPQDVADAVEDMPYDGSGTRTGQALQYVLSDLLGEENGDRPDALNIVVTITDGRSQDEVGPPSAALRAAGAITFAVGIGELDQSELEEIAGASDRVFVAPDFDALSGIVLEDLQEAVCVDENECETDNGGCSHTCVNLRGSYRCTCPAGLVLASDNRNCVADGIDHVDDCAENNGGCEHFCTDLIDGRECSCRDGFTLSTNGVSCFDTDDCFNNTCSYKCVDSLGGFFCECPETQELAPDSETQCVDRPGPADCPAGYVALGTGCMILNTEALSYSEARTACEDQGARLVKVNDAGTRDLIRRTFQGENWIGLTDRETEGTWLNSDGTEFTFTDGWAPGEPGNGDCGYINFNLFASSCGRARTSICEIPRSEGLMIFSRTWPNGAQGNLYLPADASSVRVVFPFAVEKFNVWFGSVEERVSRTEYILTQNAIEKQSGNGQIGFTIDMTTRFPDRDVTIELYEE